MAIAAFLVLDASNRNTRTGPAWLDAAILCGAVAALGGGLLLTPFVNSFPEGGIPLLVAILFPLIDVTLALVVVGQWALASRSWNRSTVGLILGFLTLAVADSSLVLNLSVGTYSISTLLSLVWGAAFMLIVGSAVTPRPPQVSMARALPGGFLIASFITAIVLLLIRPEGLLGWAIGDPGCHRPCWPPAPAWRWRCASPGRRARRSSWPRPTTSPACPTDGPSSRRSTTASPRSARWA